MNLEDFDSKADAKLRKINKYLSECFGFTMKESIPLRTLHEQRAKIKQRNKAIKLKDQMIHRNSEVAKNLLMLEGLEQMIEARTKKRKKRLVIETDRKIRSRTDDTRRPIKLKHLLEANFEKAEVALAAKGLADEITGVIEDVGRIQNEDLIALSEPMGAAYGVGQATAFLKNTNSILDELIETAKKAKFTIDNEVSKLVGGGEVVDMSTEPEPIDEPIFDPEDDEGEIPIGEPVPDEEDFDAPLGRVRKESVENIRERADRARSRIKRLKSRILRK